MLDSSSDIYNPNLNSLQKLQKLFTKSKKELNVFPKRITGIYKITNPKGKVYIGQSINIHKRFNNYKNLHKSINKQYLIKNSLKKYGFDNHKFEIILECSKYELNELERFYQDLYIFRGYILNDTLLNMRLTETDWYEGKMSKESNKKLSDSKKKYIKENYEKFIKIVTEASKGKGKIIKQLNIETEEIIKEATIDIFMEEGFDKSPIYQVCNGKMKTSQGFKWRFKDDTDEKYKSKRKVILQLDMNTKEILKEGIISDFTKNGFSKEGIYLCCNGKRKYSQGFKWSFKDFESPKFESKRNLRIIQKLNPETLEVLEEGDIYHFDEQNYKRNGVYGAIIKNYIHKSFKWRYKP